MNTINNLQTPRVDIRTPREVNRENSIPSIDLSKIENKKDVKNNGWKYADELLIKEWADHAKCYRWLHDRSRLKYRKKNTAFAIPVIILSTITGAANFAQSKISNEQDRDIFAMSLGGANIIAGIIATIAQFLKVSELLEGHRVASLSWEKYYNNLKTELAKDFKDRELAKDFLKYAKSEYDRLLEISPLFDKEIINLFNSEVMKTNPDMKFPSVLGQFENDKIEIDKNRFEEKEVEKEIVYIEREKIVEKKPDEPSYLSKVLKLMTLNEGGENNDESTASDDIELESPNNNNDNSV
jgi:hypothetical protein